MNSPRLCEEKNVLMKILPAFRQFCRLIGRDRRNLIGGQAPGRNINESVSGTRVHVKGFIKIDANPDAARAGFS
jgi:hypothetical protein